MRINKFFRGYSVWLHAAGVVTAVRASPLRISSRPLEPVFVTDKVRHGGAGERHGGENGATRISGAAGTELSDLACPSMVSRRQEAPKCRLCVMDQFCDDIIALGNYGSRREDIDANRRHPPRTQFAL